MNTLKHFCKMRRIGFMLMIPTLLSSCDMLHDNMDDCQSSIKFRYDYNMLSADAFHSQVDKVEVFFFDKEGKFITSQTESGDALKSPTYKMDVPYSLNGCTAITWAGQHDSYEIPELIPNVSTQKDLLLKMKRDANQVSSAKLESLWHGQKITLTGGAKEIGLVRNTNNVRIILKNVSDEETPVSADRFEFKITADNGYYKYDNSLLNDDRITYLPFYQTGDSQEGVIAEINTMRLMDNKDVRLSIYDKESKTYLFGGTESINLIYYLLKTKKEAYASMPNQEFLDRQFEWDLTFFYTSGTFVALKVVINGWTFWMHDIDM